MTTAASRYQALETKRQPFLDRARTSVELTIPSLLPKDGHNETTALYTPYQSIGARGVNNLASKLLLALLPPNSPFFRMAVDDFTLEEITQRPDARAEVEKALNKVERAVQGEIEGSAIRVSTYEGIKHLLHGNVLLHLPEAGGLRVFQLDKYVTLRDPEGFVLEIITKEIVAPSTLSPEILGLLEDQKTDEGTQSSVEKNLSLYTWIKWDGAKYTTHQEIQNKKIAGTEGSFPADILPWLPLRWAKIDGESYGRGYIEEYIGDLISLEKLSKAIVEAAAASAKVLFLVSPNGTTRMKDIAEAPNGAIRPGLAEEVSVLQVQKHADLAIAKQTADGIEQRLALAFLLNTAIQRNGERVTAEEIRYMAGELEDALGGVYSILSQEFQLPLVNILLARMQRQKKLPPIPKDLTKPVIVTGLEALGRGHDLTKLNNFAQIAAMAAQLPPEINKSNFLMRVGTSLGIALDGLLLSQEELQAQQQQAMMMQMMEKLGPNAVNQVGSNMQAAQEQQGAADGPPQA
jgi:hypothetical protein